MYDLRIDLAGVSPRSKGVDIPATMVGVAKRKGVKDAEKLEQNAARELWVDGMVSDASSDIPHGSRRYDERLAESQCCARTRAGRCYQSQTEEGFFCDRVSRRA